MNNQRKISCSVEILTRNSEKTLERCLGSVKDFAEIIVLDGNSTDGTLKMARRYGAKILKQYETNESEVRIVNFSEVRNKGLRLAAYDWFMFIDSDEYLSPEAVDEIRRIVESPATPAHAFWQPRRYILAGQIIECASTYPNQQIRLFRKAWVKEFIKQVHERIDLRPDAVVDWLKGVEYVPVGTLEELNSRWRRYMEKEEAMNVGASRKKILRIAAQQIGLFCLYAARFLRNFFFCRGVHMPLRYEWTRHKYLLWLSYKLLHRLFIGY